MSIRTKVRAYAPALCWGAFLLVLGGRRDFPTIETDLPLDKVVHFLLYGVLGWLTAAGWSRVRRPAWYWTIVAACLIGAADELHQRSVPGRSADALDWIADAAGIAAGYVLVVRRGARGRATEISLAARVEGRRNP